VLFDSAIPVGLVVHELLTNSIHHAFPEGRAGKVQITLAQHASSTIELEISDNGVGFDGAFDINRLSSLGLPMVFAIVKNQLKGTISVNTKGGTSFVIHFMDDLYEERV
jgi:two-component sensor histidine kinase